MAKYYGKVGYVENVEAEPGIWIEKKTEKEYSGDLLKNYMRKEGSTEINRSVNISNQVSIVADPYAMEHFFSISYIKFQIPKLAGVWKVETVDVQYPRLVLSLGGLYNGEQA